MLTLQVLGMALMLALLALARWGAMAIISSILLPALWTLGTVGIVFLALAFYGWYFRLTHDVTKFA
ncbi:MAG TPA: hypothetical protein VK961_18845 [Chthoniobacter sp.]|nr:hypothetical protein [Chthoniobacter sp.]